METQFKFELRKEREFGEKINGTFTFISQNFKTLFRCFVYIPLPLAILAGIAMGLFQSNVFRTLGVAKGARHTIPGNYLTSQLDVFTNLLSPAYFVALICMALASMLVYATTFAYMKVSLSEERENITIEKVWFIVKQKIVSLLIYNFVLAIFVILASVFFVIPGIYLAIVYSIFMPVFIFEDRSFGDSLSRCFYLIRDKWWSTFGLIIVMYIIVSLANFIFQIPQIAVTILTALRLYNDTFPALNIFASIIGTVGTFMMHSLLVIAIGLQYFNLVERKDGIGLRGLIEQIGAEPTISNKNLGEL